MKNLVLSTVVALTALGTQAQISMPQPSPTQHIKQAFGMSSVELSYSRPAAKDRKIFGDLVPFNKLWRTGANAATIIRFNDPVEIQGKKVDTGSYSVYTIPGENNWEFILNKGLKNWGVDGYKEAEDVIRVTVPTRKLKNEVENFTMAFDNIQPESMELHLNWDNTGIVVPIKTSVKDKLRAQVEAAMKGEKKPYWNAAQFYNEYEKDYAKALENINKATEENPKAFYMFLYKAKIQKAMGDNAGAKTTSQKSLELSKSAGNADYVKLNEDFLKTLK